MSETVIVALIGIAGTLLSPIVSSINERCKAKNERKLHAQRISSLIVLRAPRRAL